MGCAITVGWRTRPITSGCTSPGWRATATARCRPSCGARAPTSGTPHGKRYLDGLAGLFVVNAGPRPHGAGRGRRQAGRRAGVLPAVVVRPPEGRRAGRADRGPDPRRPQPGLLHHRRLRGRGDRLEAGPRLLQAGRQADEVQGGQPAHRLPRHVDGRAVDHRPARRSRPTSSRWCPAAIKVPNTNFYRAPEHGDVAGGVRAVGRRRDRRAIEREGPDTVAAVFLEPVQNSGGCFPPPPGYFAAGTRDLRPRTTCCSSPTR